MIGALRRPLFLSGLAAALLACGGGPSGGVAVRIRVAPGAPFAQVADSLAARGIIGSTRLFRLYARIGGRANRIKPGTYEFVPGTEWHMVLDDLIAGRIITGKLVVPEGLLLSDILARVAEFSGVDAESLRTALGDTSAARRYGVPGPTLEGYLYPATYTLPIEAGPDTIIRDMVETYERVWTPERRAAAAQAGLSEREVVTLASIIEKEAVHPEEMPLIGAVYRNRLRIGMPLQADPTVQYALGGHRERLLYADIERVRDHPYNTYSRVGLPPGPIAAPSDRAIDAALHPADVEFLYFVARPDGTHVFSRTLAEHNRARFAIRSEQRRSGASR
jgi:peptidoglycan lytic transglycosylase G